MKFYTNIGFQNLSDSYYCHKLPMILIFYIISFLAAFRNTKNDIKKSYNFRKFKYILSHPNNI